MPNSSQNLSGKIALLTGGTDGIGKEIALRLLAAGVELVIVGRNQPKAEAALAEFQSNYPKSSVSFWQADLSLMQQVQALAEKFTASYPRLDILIHCAGLTLPQRILTAEGFETVFATQYLARFLLTKQLLSHLNASESPIVVNVSAGGEENVRFDFDNLNSEKSYSGTGVLQHESIANDMMTLEMQARHPQIRFYCYGPGYVKTGLLRDLNPILQAFARFAGIFIGISPQQAADDVLLLLQRDLVGGLYGRRGKHNIPKGFRAESKNRQRLWEISESFVSRALGN